MPISIEWTTIPEWLRYGFVALIVGVAVLNAYDIFSEKQISAEGEITVEIEKLGSNIEKRLDRVDSRLNGLSEILITYRLLFLYVAYSNIPYSRTPRSEPKQDQKKQ